MKYTIGTVYTSAAYPNGVTASLMPKHKAVLLTAGSAALTFTGKMMNPGWTMESASNIAIVTLTNTSQTLPIEFSSFSALSGTNGAVTFLN